MKKRFAACNKIGRRESSPRGLFSARESVLERGKWLAGGARREGGEGRGAIKTGAAKKTFK